MKTLVIVASAAEYERAIETAKTLDGPVVWGLESTGSYANAFARRLLSQGAMVYEVPGAFTKRHRERSSRTGKSDALDAHAIAEAVLRESAPKLRCLR